MVAVVDYVIGGGGSAGTPTSLSTDWTPANGEFVACFSQIRKDGATPITFTNITGSATLRATSGSNFHGSEMRIHTMTANGAGAVQGTVSQTAGDFWNAVFIGASNGQYHSSDANSPGVFQASINFGPSGAAPAAGGLAVGCILIDGGDTYDITSPVAVIDFSVGASGGINGGCLGVSTIASGGTFSVQATQTVSDIGVVTVGWLIIEDTGGGGGGGPTYNLRRTAVGRSRMHPRAR